MTQEPCEHRADANRHQGTPAGCTTSTTDPIPETALEVIAACFRNYGEVWCICTVRDIQVFSLTLCVCRTADNSCLLSVTAAYPSYSETCVFVSFACMPASFRCLLATSQCRWEQLTVLQRSLGLYSHESVRPSYYRTGHPQWFDQHSVKGERRRSSLGHV